ncbi:MAG: hypothetical protein JRH15_17750 [Deltaproteobacteria bacterium]|nr:hypothetical protein [Deltaproteobacteria bacterium]
MTNDNEVLKRQARNILFAGCMISAIYGLPFNLMPVTLGSAADAYSFNAQQIGLLGSALLAGAVLGNWIVFFVIKRFNWQKISAIGIVMVATGFGFSPFTGGSYLLYVAWFFAGIGFALPFTVALQTLAGLGNQEKTMGTKLTSEVLLGAVLLYLFPVFLVSRWGFNGAVLGLSAWMLLGLTVLSRIPRTYMNLNGAQTEAAFDFRSNLPAIVALLTLLVFSVVKPVFGPLLSGLVTISEWHPDIWASSWLF